MTMAENDLRLEVMDGSARRSSPLEGLKQAHHDVENQTLAPDGNDDLENENEKNHVKDNEEEHINHRLLPLVSCRHNLYETYAKNRRLFAKLFKLFFLIGACLYMGFAFHHSFGDEQSLTLLGLFCFAVGYYIFSRCLRRYGKRLQQSLEAGENQSKFSRNLRRIYWWTLTLVLFGLVAYVVIESAVKRPQNLISVVGIFVFIGLLLLFSTNPEKVRWRPVIGGILLQFVFGLLVLKTSWGLQSFQWLADRMIEYLDHTDRGAQFVFGNNFAEHYVAFKVLPCIIMFSATIGILYYLGVMQVAISVVTFVMRLSLDTGPMETLHAAFNIFVGWAETVPVVQPLLSEMTMSELHAVMTNGFATVSGGTLAAYILYGAPANHLISASFMSAPAALSLSKLFYPEKTPKRHAQKTPKIKSKERGVIEAASSGAIGSISIIAYILVHLIAFLSILDFVNDTLAWLGARVGVTPPDYPVLSFQYITSYLMWPVAFLLGVEIADCRPVARMLGVKIFVNEFLAFEDLGVVRANNRILQNYTSGLANNTWHWTPTDDIMLDATGQVLVGGVISERSATITTYALCGFSDLVALGIMIGAFSAVAPSRRRDILHVAPRALITGVMACFLTAAMAGLMVD